MVPEISAEEIHPSLRGADMFSQVIANLDEVVVVVVVSVNGGTENESMRDRMNDVRRNDAQQQWDHMTF